MESDLLGLPLEVKIYVKPKSNTVFCRGKLGEQIYGRCPFFDLDDPYIRRMSLQYNCLHDPHLRDYHKRQDILRLLRRQGVITSDNKVVCTVKEFNEYRHYLTRIKLQSEKILGKQEKSKENLLESGRLRRGKIALDKDQTYSRAELGSAAQRKLDNTADALFKAVFEQLTAAEAQKLQELVETVVHEVFGRIRVPQEHYVNFLRRAARRIRGIVFDGCVRTETPLDHRQDIEMVAKELVAKVLEILGNHLESKASEPGRAARHKEQPVDAGAIQADKSKDAGTDRAQLHACLDKLTREVVKNVRCLLKSMVASQFEGDSSYEYTEILKLPKGKVSNKHMQQGFPEASEKQSQEASTGVKLPPLEPQLHAEETGYAKAMESEDAAMVKGTLVRERNPANSGNILDIRTMANQIVQSLMDQTGQHGPAPILRENVQEPVPNPATSQGGEDSCTAENTLPSVDQKVSQEPVPNPATSQGGEESCTAENTLPSVDQKVSQEPVPNPATSQGGEESCTAENTLPSVDQKVSQEPVPPEGLKPPAQP